MKIINRKLKAQFIKEHGNNLNAIFNTGIEPVDLYKKLLRLERKANKAAECLCNTNTLNYFNYRPGLKQATDDEIKQFFNKIISKVEQILGPQSKGLIIVNLDPRGYALKIPSEIMKSKNLNIYQDWGGNGIIAPEF